MRPACQSAARGSSRARLATAQRPPSPPHPTGGTAFALSSCTTPLCPRPCTGEGLHQVSQLTIPFASGKAGATERSCRGSSQQLSTARPSRRLEIRREPTRTQHRSDGVRLTLLHLAAQWLHLYSTCYRPASPLSPCVSPCAGPCKHAKPLGDPVKSGAGGYGRNQRKTL